MALVDFDPEGEDKVIAAMLLPVHVRCPSSRSCAGCGRSGPTTGVAIMRAYVGDRTNRRHRPGRALERSGYRFDVLSDYGAFRDLQRHRMLTIEWQDLGPRHGYEMPDAVAEAGLADRYERSMARSAALYDVLADACVPTQAPYAVALAYRVRYVMQMNAREAMHLVELRSGDAGPSRVPASSRRTCTGSSPSTPGTGLIAEAMTFVDHRSYDLERLGSEKRAEARRSATVRS